ncbi:MAG: hypothetical protein ABL962_10515, partial [Fimbriimonadaceae bacterium]
MGKSARWLKIGKIAAIAIVTALVGAYTIDGSRARNADKAILGELAEIRRLGFPTVPDEVKTIPVADNAAPLYEEAIRRNTQLMIARPSPYVNGIPDPSYARSIVRHLNEKQSVLDAIELAAAKPRCLLSNFYQGTTFEQYFEVMEFNWLALQKAEVLAQSGQFEEAFKWLRIARKVAMDLRQPILIGIIYSINGEVECLKLLQKLIRIHSGDATFARLAAQFCRDSGPLPSIREAMAGQILSSRWTLREYEAGRDPSVVKLISPVAESQTTVSMNITSMRKDIELRFLSRC